MGIVAAHPLRAPVGRGDGRAQLQARLDDEVSVLIALAERIGRDGLDPADMAEYTRLLERVEALRTALRDAEIPGDVVDDPTVVEVGDEIQVACDDGSERSTLAHPIEACDDDHRLPVRSPLGSALAGARIGDPLSVRTPARPYTASVRSRRRAR